MKYFIIVIGFIISELTLAESDRLGVDFLKTIDWGYLCPNVQPVPISNSMLQCSVSHPASSMHNKKIFSLFKEQLPQVISCKYLEDQYKQYTTNIEHEKGREWELCYTAFYASFIDRRANPEHYKESISEWKRKYFSK